MDPTYEAFAKANNFQLTDYQRKVLFSKFNNDNTHRADTLINDLTNTGKYVAFARALNVELPSYAGLGEEARMLVVEIINNPTLTAYKVGSVMVAMNLQSAKDYTAFLSGYKAHKGVAFSIDPSDPFEIFLKQHNIQLTQHQRTVLFSKFIDADFEYQNTFINQLGSSNGWEKMAAIASPDSLRLDSRMWVATAMSAPGLTALKVVRTAVSCQLGCAKDFCKALSSFELPAQPEFPVVKMIEAHPVETPAPNEVATRVILEQMEKLKQKTENEKKLEEEIKRLRAAVAVPLVAVAAAPKPAAAAAAAPCPVEDDCTVCQEAKINAVIIPCGHMACCLECIANIQKRSNECPICRTNIVNAVKVFKS